METTSLSIVEVIGAYWPVIVGAILAFEVFMLAMQKITKVTPWKWDDNIVAVIINGLKFLTGFLRKNK